MLLIGSLIRKPSARRPAKAGTHFSGSSMVERWAPGFRRGDERRQVQEARGNEVKWDKIPLAENPL
jgi:hypothetical protein